MLEEKTKNLSAIIKAVSKKNTSKPKEKTKATIEEPVVCSDYVKMIQEKKLRNKKKLQDLGLVEKTPTPNNTNQDKEKNTPKNVEEKKSARRKLMQSPR